MKFFPMFPPRTKIMAPTLYLVYTVYHGVLHGFKMGGGAKTIIELESEPKFNINL